MHSDRITFFRYVIFDSVSYVFGDEDNLVDIIYGQQLNFFIKIIITKNEHVCIPLYLV